MRRHELLAGLHARLRPRSYLEVGVADGRSLGLSRAPSIAVDPGFSITSELHCPVQLVRTTSDEFFARPRPLASLPRPVLDLAFIDGMHLAEYAMRDFINVERHTTPGSVIVLDDMLPRHPDEAARDRALGARRGAWAGDVFKVAHVLRTRRPDLIVLDVDTTPTGTLVVLLPDAASTVLLQAYDELVPDLVSPDPQDVPREILHRSCAVSPERLLAAPVWHRLRMLRRYAPARVQDANRARVEQVLRSNRLASAA